MSSRYHLEPGYITIPEANAIVLRMLKIVGKEDKTQYNKLLNGAKKGLFGGKKYGSRMYQVRKEGIIHYAEECLQAERLKLLNIEIVTELESINQSTRLDTKTANELLYFLKTLSLYQIISNETLEKSKKKIIMRIGINT